MLAQKRPDRFALQHIRVSGLAVHDKARDAVLLRRHAGEEGAEYFRAVRSGDGAQFAPASVLDHFFQVRQFAADEQRPQQVPLRTVYRQNEHTRLGRCAGNFLRAAGDRRGENG